MVYFPRDILDLGHELGSKPTFVDAWHSPKRIISRVVIILLYDFSTLTRYVFESHGIARERTFVL